MKLGSIPPLELLEIEIGSKFCTLNLEIGLFSCAQKLVGVQGEDEELQRACQQGTFISSSKKFPQVVVRSFEKAEEANSEDLNAQNLAVLEFRNFSGSTRHGRIEIRWCAACSGV
ncbi:hypothetical protein Droror1_Dr00019446 [Drosera rotundifolia]